MAVICSPVAGLIVLSLQTGPPAPPKESRRRFRLSVLFSLLLTLIPFGVMSANAFFVKNCSLLEGTAYYLLLVIPSVLYAACLAFLVFSVRKEWRKTTFIVLVVLHLLHIILVTMSGPRIFAFDPIIGYFPGITHDESISVFPRLVLFRAVTFLAAGMYWFAGLAFLRRRVEKIKVLATAQFRIATVALLALAAVFVWSDDLGLSSSDDSIKSALGGVCETQHFEIIYPADRLTPARLEEVAMFHEYLYDRTSALLRVSPTRKIRSFLYRSSTEKGRLIGAGWTDITKPWLSQIHINLDDVESTLPHELVHVMAAAFGFPLVRASLRSGLTEGLAVAIADESDGRTLHRTAAEILTSGVKPDISLLVSLFGFFQISPAVSYPLAGSFCKFLINRYGLRRFKTLYRTANFEILYGKDVEQLAAEWRRYLDTIPVTQFEVEKSNYLYRRPSIFLKECARVVAERTERTRSMLSRKQYQAALDEARQTLKLSRTPEAIQQEIAALFRLHEYRPAIDEGRKALRDSTLGGSLLPLKLMVGDCLWALSVKGEPAGLNEARKLYGELLETHLSDGWDEACAVRLAITGDSKVRAALQPVYVEDISDSARNVLLDKMSSAGPAAIISRYLRARDRFMRGDFSAAVELLQNVRMIGNPILESLRLGRLGRSYFYSGHYEMAKESFQKQLAGVPHETLAGGIQEWIERCEWAKTYEHRFD